MKIAVVALVGTKRLTVGTYNDLAIASEVAESWAKWSGCRAAIVAPSGGVPLILIRPSPSIVTPTTR